ncbi:hypothetical protein LEP1GSC188_4441 [Leptospira weilii serovar Topaz str. LT2116]|uniref:Uncharacterized protein n=1 Tax=Leptospira weilii serovar Topaz str. LT2116 TaxID=1088540 RepID=M3GDE9_9LEPT|nr:hypothetical protein LEP1GSC188_4441 [Leptospira weilii serovar Topaz str. LT2116]
MISCFFRKVESVAVDKQKFMEKAEAILNGFRSLNKNKILVFKCRSFLNLALEK